MRIGTTTSNTQNRMSKIIFVDIDGPLAHGTWMDEEVEIETFRNSSQTVKIPYAWVREDCEALAEIAERTDSYIVVSSDWRKFYTLRDLKAVFQYYGVDPYFVIDITTQYNPKKKMSSPLEWDRACEIKSWIDTFKPESWIAIDDMPLEKIFKRMGLPEWRAVDVDGSRGEGERLRDKIAECVEKLGR